MNPRQIQILATLVSFAEQHMGLDPYEREVVQIVKQWDEQGGTPRTYNYKTVAACDEPLSKVANHYADRGWRVVGLVGRTNFTSMLLERPVGITHPDD